MTSRASQEYLYCMKPTDELYVLINSIRNKRIGHLCISITNVTTVCLIRQLLNFCDIPISSLLTLACCRGATPGSVTLACSCS